jgi:hypothetical protein
MGIRSPNFDATLGNSAIICSAGSIAFFDMTNYYPSQSVKSWRVNYAQAEQ